MHTTCLWNNCIRYDQLSALFCFKCKKQRDAFSKWHDVLWYFCCRHATSCLILLTDKYCIYSTWRIIMLLPDELGKLCFLNWLEKWGLHVHTTGAISETGDAYPSGILCCFIWIILFYLTFCVRIVVLILIFVYLSFNLFKHVFNDLHFFLALNNWLFCILVRSLIINY